MSIHRKNFLIMMGISALAYFFTLLPFSDAFSRQAVIMMAITILSAGFWMTECLPLAVTAVVVVLLEIIFGILDIKTGLAYIASPINSIIIAGCIIATSFSKYDLDRRVGLSIVRVMGNRTNKLLLGVMIATAFISMWISNTATMLLMLPIISGLLKMTKIDSRRSNLGKVMMLGAAFAANIGGVGTPAGTPVNSIAIGFMDEFLGVQVKFLDWFLFALPFVIIALPLAYKILLCVYPPEIDYIEGGIETVQNELKEMGPLSGKQKHVLTLFGLAICLWLADSFFPLMPGWLYIASILIALIFLLPLIGVVEWEEASRDIAWGVIILIGGALALGNGLNSTGVIEVIAAKLSIVLEGTNNYLIITVLTFTTAFSITLFSSITATGTTFVPMAIALALQLGLNPVTTAIAVAFSASMAFLLPSSTAPNAIAYSSGYFKSHEMTKVGLIVTVVTTVGIAILVNTVWPFIYTVCF